MACMALGLFGLAPALAEKNVILATTTSTQDTGLLDVLIPRVREEDRLQGEDHRRGLRPGHGHGQKGEADVLLVHSPDGGEEVHRRASA